MDFRRNGFFFVVDFAFDIEGVLKLGESSNGVKFRGEFVGILLGSPNSSISAVVHSFQLSPCVFVDLALDDMLFFLVGLFSL